MSTPDIPVPVNVQENEISGNLNGSMLLNFLMDMEMLPRLGTIIPGNFGSIDTFGHGIRAHLIIESAAAYSMVLLLKSIIVVVPSTVVLGSPLRQVDYYMEGILIFVSGIAPTVLVARIATNDKNSVASSTLTHISSDLQFGPQQGSGSGHSGNTTGDVNTSVHADNSEPTAVIELQRESSVDAVSGDDKV
ncbi:hypothetical protein CVT25_002015 [Psilocybe cyanescens]|uniref:Uncharacterized protein n=1 Tax=Psilocybe cyanescens TaxID=93625 RepID=A0A409XWC4_PSICY|nr:hypothetical protein CVT25_002015 [Psilocybe cyanescens]